MEKFNFLIFLMEKFNFLTGPPLSIASWWTKPVHTACLHINETRTYRAATFCCDQQKPWKLLMLLNWKVWGNFCPLCELYELPQAENLPFPLGSCLGKSLSPNCSSVFTPQEGTPSLPSTCRNTYPAIEWDFRDVDCMHTDGSRVKPSLTHRYQSKSY